MKNVTFEFATAQDEASVRELLIASQLPHEDIEAHLRHFIVAKDGKNIIGCIGLEIADQTALLRSFAVSAAYRSRGVGKELCARIEEYARYGKFQTMYLMTTTAAEYFAKRGYEKLDRESVPQAIRSTRQFRDLCPSSAIVMKMKL